MFGWREVKSAMNHKEYVCLVGILQQKEVKYYTKTMRGLNDYIYTVCVKKKDFDYASYLLR